MGRWGRTAALCELSTSPVEAEVVLNCHPHLDLPSLQTNNLRLDFRPTAFTVSAEQQPSPSLQTNNLYCICRPTTFALTSDQKPMLVIRTFWSQTGCGNVAHYKGLGPHTTQSPSDVLPLPFEVCLYPCGQKDNESPSSLTESHL